MNKDRKTILAENLKKSIKKRIILQNTMKERDVCTSEFDLGYDPKND